MHPKNHFRAREAEARQAHQAWASSPELRRLYANDFRRFQGDRLSELVQIQQTADIAIHAAASERTAASLEV